MMEDKREIDKLIREYFIRGLNEFDLDRLKKWIERSDDNKSYFSMKRALWLSTTSIEDKGRFNPDEAFGYFKKRINIQKKRPRVKSYPNRFYLKVAMSLVVLFVVALCSFFLGKIIFSEKRNAFTIQVPKGSISQLCLPDGTTVCLNSETKLVYTEFQKIRNVQLSGQAYFEVKHNASSPFRVEVGKVSIMDVGTHFCVESYKDEKNIDVFLKEGKIGIFGKSGSKCSMLNPMEEAVISKKTNGITVLHNADCSRLDWMAGKLVFNHSYLPQLVKVLERRYNVDIELKDSKLEQYCFHGSFNSKTQSLEDIFHVLSLTNKISYRRSGNRIFLYSR